jgi:hypothetical protein
MRSEFYGNPFHAITFGILTVIAVFQLVRGKNPIDMPEKGMKMIIAIEISFWYWGTYLVFL